MKHNCSHCRRAERVQTDKVRLVSGKINGRGYRGFLCDEHLEMLCNDGLSFRLVIALDRTVIAQARAAYNHAVRTVTLNAEGLAKLDELRNRMWIAEIDSAQEAAR